MAKSENDTKHGKSLQQATPQQPRYPSTFEDMEHWFDDIFHRQWMSPFMRRHPLAWPEFEPWLGANKPRVDVIDRSDEVLVRAELPGIAKEDVDVSLGDRSLTIRASSRREKKEESDQFFRRELAQGEFRRTVELPCDVNGDKAKASFKDGVLELTLPKMEGAKRKSIKVD